MLWIRTPAPSTATTSQTWLLFFLESHGATITVSPTHKVHVDLDSMPGLTADVVARWAPVITTLLPEIGEILRGRTVGEAKA